MELIKLWDVKKETATEPQFTDHCFTGEYPIDVSEILKVNSKIG